MVVVDRYDDRFRRHEEEKRARGKSHDWWVFLIFLSVDGCWAAFATAKSLEGYYFFGALLEVPILGFVWLLHLGMGLIFVLIGTILYAITETFWIKLGRSLWAQLQRLVKKGGRPQYDW